MFFLWKYCVPVIESTMTWGKHIDLITSKVNSLTYMIRFLRPVLSLKIIKQIYSSYVHSILTYNIIFWGISPDSKKVFIAQKKIIRIIMQARPNTACRTSFREVGILTLYSQYILSMVMFIVKNTLIHIKWDNSQHRYAPESGLTCPCSKINKGTKGSLLLGHGPI